MKAFAGVAFALLFVYGIFSSAGGKGMRYSPRDLLPYRFDIAPTGCLVSCNLIKTIKTLPISNAWLKLGIRTTYRLLNTTLPCLIAQEL